MSSPRWPASEYAAAEHNKTPRALRAHDKCDSATSGD